MKTQSEGCLKEEVHQFEAMVKKLKVAHDLLHEENRRQQALISIYGEGISCANTHLSYLVMSQCAFSRETRNVLRLEGAYQAS